MTKEDTFYQEACDYYARRFSAIARSLRIMDHATELGHYDWADNIRSEHLVEMPLSVSCVAIYPLLEECEWEILLGTGGPADRVLVTTDYAGDIDRARYEYQDWFQPWTEPLNQDDDVVQAFAELFYFSPVSELGLC